MYLIIAACDSQMLQMMLYEYSLYLQQSVGMWAREFFFHHSSVQSGVEQRREVVHVVDMDHNSCVILIQAVRRYQC